MFWTTLWGYEEGKREREREIRMRCFHYSERVIDRSIPSASFSRLMYATYTMKESGSLKYVV